MGSSVESTTSNDRFKTFSGVVDESLAKESVVVLGLFCGCDWSVGFTWGFVWSGCIIGGAVLPYNSKFRL